jgi:hypothetical protein
VYDKHGQRRQPRLELRGLKVDRTFAKYTGETFKVYTKDWFRKLKFCSFEEYNLSGLPSFSFEVFEVLELLEIQRSDIEPDWKTLMNQIALIPSENFKKLTIIT